MNTTPSSQNSRLKRDPIVKVIHRELKGNETYLNAIAATRKLAQDKGFKVRYLAYNSTRNLFGAVLAKSNVDA